jgi:hypothetical protein
MYYSACVESVVPAQTGIQTYMSVQPSLLEPRLRRMTLFRRATLGKVGAEQLRIKGGNAGPGIAITTKFALLKGNEYTPEPRHPCNVDVHQ